MKNKNKTLILFKNLYISFFSKILHRWKSAAFPTVVFFAICIFNGILSAQDMITPASPDQQAVVSVWPHSLSFGPFTGQPAGQEKILSLDDPGVVVFTINAPETYEISVTADLPDHITHEKSTGITLPVRLQFAYANNRENTENEARGSSLAVAPGITAFSFPVCRESGGIMLPAEITGKHSAETIYGKCHLFLYGKAGPSVSGQQLIAGNYEANFHVMITATPPIK